MTPPADDNGKQQRSGRKRLLERLAPLVLAFWIGGTAAALVLIPPLSPTGSRNQFSGAISPTAAPLQTQIEVLHRFAFPLLAQDVVVQHRSSGLSLLAQARTVARAAELDLGALPRFKGIAGAIPVTNELRLLPSSRQSGTTALTFLFFRPSVSPTTSAQRARQYAHRYLDGPGDGYVGVTGAYGAEAAQGSAISGSLGVVEIISVLLLVVIVAVTFRSIVAPLLTLFTAGMAYELSQRLLSLASRHAGITVPDELDPVIVVLLLGIMTDYSVFYLSALRRNLRSGADGRAAARGAWREVTPVVLAAGVTVAGGVALIQTAHLPLFSSLGPPLAITVGVAVAVAVTFLPASLALLRRGALWPAHPERQGKAAKLRRRLQHRLTRKGVAAVVVVGAAAVLVLLAIPLRDAGIGINLMADLSSSSSASQATRAADSGFSPGIVAPTEVVVGTAHAAGRLPALSRLQTLIAHQPGVAGVIGPANKLTDLPLGAFVAGDDSAARYLVVLAGPPLGDRGIASFKHLKAEMPQLTSKAGLPGAVVNYAGDTALSATITRPAKSDLVRVGLLIIAADVAVMVLFLRSLVAPVLLAVASASVVAAALGIAVLVFPAPGGFHGFTFYVPFAAEVLLLSFGADYNLFLTGEIWHTAGRRPFRVAVAEGGTRASTAINIAGLTLAASFAVLFVVPLTSFRELALIMVTGLLLDTFLVRFAVVPAMLSLLGRRAQWPDLRRHHTNPAATNGSTGVGEGQADAIGQGGDDPHPPAPTDTDKGVDRP